MPGNMSVPEINIVEDPKFGSLTSEEEDFVDVLRQLDEDMLRVILSKVQAALQGRPHA